MSAYNEAVRHYTIKMMSGFAKFNYPLCKRSVTTRGSSFVRTAAAAPKQLGQ